MQYIDPIKISCFCLVSKHITPTRARGGVTVPAPGWHYIFCAQTWILVKKWIPLLQSKIYQLSQYPWHIYDGHNSQLSGWFLLLLEWPHQAIYWPFQNRLTVTGIKIGWIILAIKWPHQAKYWPHPNRLNFSGIQMTPSGKILTLSKLAKFCRYYNDPIRQYIDPINSVEFCIQFCWY